MSAGLVKPARPPPAGRPPPASPFGGVAVRRFTVDEYHRMIRDGYFAQDERFELLDGLIVRKMPKDPIHEATIGQGRKVLPSLLPGGSHVRVGGPITLAESEPEPDLCVARGDELDYGGRHPSPADIALVVEVSNTTLADDRSWKGPIYARDLVPAYWILNVVDWQIEVYTEPSGPAAASAYRRREDFLPGQAVTLAWPGGAATVPVDLLLPARLRAMRP